MNELKFEFVSKLISKHISCSSDQVDAISFSGDSKTVVVDEDKFEADEDKFEADEDKFEADEENSSGWGKVIGLYILRLLNFLIEGELLTLAFKKLRFIIAILNQF